MFSVPYWISDKRSVDSLHEYQMRMNINQFPFASLNHSENGIKLQDVTVKSNIPVAPPYKMVFHILKQKQCWVYLFGRADTHPWPHSWQSKYYIKSTFTSQESQFKT